jgi:hypothetical protein
MAKLSKQIRLLLRNLSTPGKMMLRLVLSDCLLSDDEMTQDLRHSSRVLKKTLGCLLVQSVLASLISCGGDHRNRIDIEHGRTPSIDGVFSSGEWRDANSIKISVEPGWTVQVFFKHDNSNLLIAFSNLVTNGRKLYPELLLDMANAKTASWEPGDWWLHASYNDCEGNGVFSVYTFGDNGSCQKDHADWTANNFPLSPEGVIEIKIPYAKIGLVPSNGKAVGIAFDVTDATSKWYFWPADAEQNKPSTWAVATSSDGWQ